MSKPIRLQGALLSLLLVPAAVAHAGVQPSGTAFPLSSCADCRKELPAVAGSVTGAFAVAWEGATTADPKGIPLRLFTKNGLPRGGQIQVNKDLPPQQYDAAIAADPKGNYLVAWSAVTGNNSDVFVQRFSPIGQPLGTTTTVNIDDPASPMPPNDSSPAVAFTTDGGFLVTWVHFVPPGATTPGTDPEIFARRFGPTGAALSAPHSISTGQVEGERPDLCVDASGKAVAVWTSIDQRKPFEPSHKGVSARRLTAAGVADGATIVVAPPLIEDSSVAVSCGTAGVFVVVWRSDQAPATDDGDILARRYSKLGRALGPATRVSSVTQGVQRLPQISHDKSGNYVVVWASDGDTEGIFGRRFAAAGTPLGDDFAVRVRTTGISKPLNPDVAQLGTKGDFVVVWQEAVTSLLGQRFTVTKGSRPGRAAAQDSLEAPDEPGEDGRR